MAMTLSEVEFVRRLALHILPPGFTKIRHYGILGNNRRAKLIPLARAALKKSRWHLPSSPVTPLPKPPRETSGCPECGSEDLICMGRLDADGDFTKLARGATRARIRAGPPPPIQDSS